MNKQDNTAAIRRLEDAFAVRNYERRLHMASPELLRIVRGISTAWDRPDLSPEEFFRVVLAPIAQDMREVIAKIEGH